MQADMFSSVVNMDKMMAKGRQAFQEKTEQIKDGNDSNRKNSFFQILNNLNKNCSSDTLKNDKMKEDLQKIIEGENAKAYLYELFPMLKLDEIDTEKIESEDGLEYLILMLKNISGQVEPSNLEVGGDEFSADGQSPKLQLENLIENTVEENLTQTSKISEIMGSVDNDSLAVQVDGKKIDEITLKGNNADQGQIKFLNEIYGNNFNKIEKEVEKSPSAVMNSINSNSDDLIQNDDKIARFENAKEINQDKAQDLKSKIAVGNDVDEKFLMKPPAENKKTDSVQTTNLDKFDAGQQESESRISKDYSSNLTKTENNFETITLESGDDTVEKFGSDKNISHTTQSKAMTQGLQSRQTEIIRQVVESARISNNKDHNEITIKLKPEILGNIRLNISTENNHVTIKVIADSTSVKDILEHNLHHLKAGFVNQGLEIGSFDVMVGDDPQDLYKGQNFSGFQRGRKQTSGQKRGMWNFGGEESEISTEGPHRSDIDKDRIDYYV